VIHQHPSLRYFLFFFFIWVWTQGLTLARQALYHLSHSTSPSKVFSLPYAGHTPWPWAQSPIGSIGTKLGLETTHTIARNRWPIRGRNLLKPCLDLMLAACEIAGLSDLVSTLAA
jgi:hypothetical protein